MWIIGLLFLAVAVYFCWPYKVVPAAVQSPSDGHTLPTIRGPGDFDVEVVGESHYQHQLIKICGSATRDGVSMNTKATLFLEDTNKFDKKAVRVDIGGAPVGYLDRESSRIFRRSIHNSEMKNYSAFQCEAIIAGGWDRGDGDTGMYGVRLDLPDDMS